VYLIRNVFNGKVYVGQTSQTLEKRWAQHVLDATLGSTFHIHNAIRKWKVKSFEITLLKECPTRKDADDTERLCIQSFRSNDRKFGYNMTEGGYDKKHESRKPSAHEKAISQRLRDHLPIHCRCHSYFYDPRRA
jgi:group I intron endonuclease